MLAEKTLRADRVSPTWGLAVCAAVAMTLGLPACGAAAPSLLEDKARRDVPIAICRKPLAATDVNEAGLPLPEAYWNLLFPSFHNFGAPVDTSTLDCVGDAISVTESLERPGTRSPPSVRVAPANLTLAPTQSGLQLAWYQTFPVSDLLASGFVALVQSRASELDAYAIGLYRGSAHHSRFEFARMGMTGVVIAYDEGCADVKVGVECESTAWLYLVNGGQLVAAARTPSAGLRAGTTKEVGRVIFRLTTTPPLVDGRSVHIKETLSVRDSGDNEIRKSEGERVFVLRGVELAAGQESIWREATAH